MAMVGNGGDTIDYAYMAIVGKGRGTIAYMAMVGNGGDTIGYGFAYMAIVDKDRGTIDCLHGNG